MSIDTTLKFGVIASAFLLGSCTSDLPDAPEFKFAKSCKLPGSEFCFSYQEINAEDCKTLGGTVIEKEDFAKQCPTPGSSSSSSSSSQPSSSSSDSSSSSSDDSSSSSSDSSSSSSSDDSSSSSSSSVVNGFCLAPPNQCYSVSYDDCLGDSYRGEFFLTMEECQSARN